MPTQIIKVPPSTTEQTIEINIPDAITYTAQVDIPNEFSFIVKGTTIPIPDVPPIKVDPPPVTGYKLTAQEGYDKLSDLSANQIGVTSEKASLAPYFSTTITKDSPGSFRSVVPAGGNNISQGQRSEQQYNDASHNPIEGAVDYDVYYDHAALPGNGSSIQWHPNNGGSALLFLHTLNLKFQVGRSIDLKNGDVKMAVNYYQTGTLKDIEPKRWYHLRWEFKWSTGNDGYARLLIDGQIYYTFTGRTQDSDGQPYCKIGQNRWGNLTGDSVVYFDNVKISAKS